MLTAKQITKKTGINLRSVRYRLEALRNAGMPAKQVGNTFTYYAEAVKKVKDFD